jgi:hypothetical protein
MATVLNSRLFATLAVTVLAFAFLQKQQVIPRANLWLRVGGLSLAPLAWEVLGGLLCAILALAYFGAARLTGQPPNQIIGLAGFSLVATALAVWLVLGFFTARGMPPARVVVMIAFTATLVFVLGLILSVLGLAWGGHSLS